jgi:hypothetical protein
MPDRRPEARSPQANRAASEPAALPLQSVARQASDPLTVIRAGAKEPWLYLKGISTGDFSEALAALLGPDAEGLSSSTITRLKAVWWEEYEARCLSR